jgi:hypothetical protein
MPNERVIVCTRPDFDTATLYASYWVGVTLRLLEERGLIITDLLGDLANLDKLVEALNSFDPISFWGVGHGNETQFAGQNAVIILERGVNENLFVGRIVHLTSCLTGVAGGLLDSIAKGGAIASIGYAAEFIVGIDTPNFPVDDPTNKATQSFLEPDCQIEISLANGKTIAEAIMDSTMKSNEWIEYWRKSGHPDTDILIMVLISNRDYKVVYGVPEVVSRLVAEPLNPLVALASTASLLSLGLVIVKW